MTNLDKTLVGLVILFSLALCASYWVPGENQDAFKSITWAVTTLLSFFLGKKTDQNA